MKKPKRIYYARPSPDIDTVQDIKNLAILKQQFPGAKIDAATIKQCTKKKGMEPFLKRVDKSSLVVISESEKNHVSAGVFCEAQHSLHDKKPVMVLRSGKLKPVKKLTVIPSPVQSGKWGKVQLQKN